MALQFQELSPVLFTLMKSTEPFLDYMLDLEETMRQIAFVNVCSILTDPRHRTVTATVPYWIEVTKPLKFSRSKHFTKQNLVRCKLVPIGVFGFLMLVHFLSQINYIACHSTSVY